METGPDIAPLSVGDWTMSLLCLILPRGSPRIFEFLPTSSNTLMTAAHRVFKTLYGQYPFVCTKTRNFLSNVLCRWCVNCKEYSTVNTELKGRLLKVTAHSTSTYTEGIRTQTELSSYLYAASFASLNDEIITINVPLIWKAREIIFF